MLCKTMAQLSVNVNKIATLRNSRGGDVPNLLKVVEDIIRFGPHGITVHPRPDERHIRKKDVYDISSLIHRKETSPEFNIEGYPSDSFLALINEVEPDQVTLVPDPPEALTSSAGWKVKESISILSEARRRIRSSRVSVFIDVFHVSPDDLGRLKDLGVNRIELFTEAYAKSFTEKSNLKEVLSRYQQVCGQSHHLGLGVNAGHDLNLDNLDHLIKACPEILEVSIGHALISEALYFGLEETISRYLAILRPSGWTP